MSWQAYIDNDLMREISPGHQLTSAAIIGLNGNVWAQSENFPQLSATEVANIVNGFQENSMLFQNGLFIAGTKYTVLQVDPGKGIRGKKGQGGTTIRKTVGALVFGIYVEPCTQQECDIAVERFGEYLKSVGY